MKINQELIFIKGDFISILSFSILRSKRRKTTNANTYLKNLSKRIAIKTLSIPIPITYTPIYTKKLGQVGHLLINLSGSINLPVIYNIHFSGAAAGSFWSTSSSPSINWSALRQTLFQRAYFIGELFGKGRKAFPFSSFYINSPLRGNINA